MKTRTAVLATLIELKLILDQLDRFERRLRHAMALKTP
jgi:hypothetical protein